MSTISEIRTALPTGTWKVDPVHSTVAFSVKHMVVANFRGGFDTFDVTLDENGLRGTVDVASVTVSEPNLNGHLLVARLLRRRAEPAAVVPLDGDPRLGRRARHRRRADAQGRHPAGHDHGHGERPGDARLRRQLAPRPRARDGHRPDGVRPQLERTAPDRRLRSRQRRQAHAELELVGRRRCRSSASPAACARARTTGSSSSSRRSNLPDGVELAVWEGLRDLPAFDEDEEGTPSLAVAGFRSAVAAADAVLIATPEYNGSIPGALKNALDWGSRPQATSAFRGKPVAVIGASPGSFGGVWAHAETRKVLGLMGARVVEAELSLGKAHDRLAEPDEELARAAARGDRPARRPRPLRARAAAA